MITVEQAADAADAFLADYYTDGSTVSVIRDPTFVMENEKVFVFSRDDDFDDDQVLQVDKATGEASFVVVPPTGPTEFDDLVPVEPPGARGLITR